MFFPAATVCCVVTGASRGLGREIASQLAQLSCDRMDLVLTARSESDLLSLVHDIEEHACQERVKTHVVAGSLENKDTLDQIREVLQKLATDVKYDQAALVHNAGSLDDPSKLLSQYGVQSLDTLNSYFCLNVTSFICLTSVFLTAFPVTVTGSRLLVNISSLAGVQALKGMSVYGSGKAARDALVRSLAHEQPDVRCISYAPGPLQTDMADTLRAKGYLKDFFENRDNLLQPKTTVAKLIRILQENSYENGTHIDFFDE